MEQVVVGGLRVEIDARFRWAPFTLAVAAVVHRQHIGGKLPQKSDVLDAVGQVAGVAVEVEDGERSTRRLLRRLVLRSLGEGGSRGPPGVQPHTVGGGKENVLDFNPHPAWVPLIGGVAVRKKDQPLLEHPHQQHQQQQAQ